MQFSFKITVGTTEITLTEEAASHQEFVKRLSFYSSIPTKGPNGEDDLRFVYRATSQGHEYYSIISDKANKEYKFGQSQKEPGTMYGKGWEDKFEGDEGQAPAANGGLGQQAPAQNNQAPAGGLNNQVPPQNTQTPPQQNNLPPQQNNLPPQQNNLPPQQNNLPPQQNNLPPQQNNLPANNAPANNTPPANNAPANGGPQLGNLGNQLNNINNNNTQQTPPAQNNGAVNDVLAKYGIQQG